MNSYAIYSILTGAVDRIYSGSLEEAELQPQSGEQFISVPGDFRASQVYVANNAVLSKQSFDFQISSLQILANSSDTVTISNIPAGTTIRWHDDLIEEITDGLAELSTDMPSTYKLQFTNVAYLDEEVAIEALPAN